MRRLQSLDAGPRGRSPSPPFVVCFGLCVRIGVGPFGVQCTTRAVHFGDLPQLCFLTFGVTVQNAD